VSEVSVLPEASVVSSTGEFAVVVSVGCLPVVVSAEEVSPQPAAKQMQMVMAIASVKAKSFFMSFSPLL
jgi:hypothetical protein